MADNSEQGSGARTIALLKLIAASGGAFTLTEISKRAGMPPSSVHRLLRPLQRSGLVDRADGQAYRAGSEFLRIAGLVLRQVDIGALARPVLGELWNDCQETCAFCLYKPSVHRAHIVEMIQTLKPLRFVLEPFTELSLTWGSLGRAILAYLPDAEADAAMSLPGVSPLTGLPPPPKSELLHEIAAIRRQGFAYYRNDSIDVAGIAAPVRRADGLMMGSLGVTLPASRLPPANVEPLSRQVTAAARRLSLALGYEDLP